MLFNILITVLTVLTYRAYPIFTYAPPLSVLFFYIVTAVAAPNILCAVYLANVKRTSIYSVQNDRELFSSYLSYM